MGNILDILSEFAQLFAEVDSKDITGLGELHTLSEHLIEQVNQSDEVTSRVQETVQAAATAVCDLLEKVILGDVDDADKALELIGRSWDALQQLLEKEAEGLDASGVSFPPELNLPAANQPSQPQSSCSEAGSITLPENVDAGIFREFLAALPYVLEELEAAILTAEQDPSEDNRNSIKGILHNLKGESGLMGLDAMSDHCHKTETLLIESTGAFPASELLTAKDYLQQALTQLSEAIEDLPVSSQAPSEPVELPPPVAMAPEQEEGIEPDRAFDINDSDVSLVIEFIQESLEHLESAERDILTIEENPEDKETINAVFRAFHTIKGVAGFLNLTPIGKLAHSAENLLDQGRKGNVVLTGSCTDVIFESMDVMKQMLATLRQAAEQVSPFVSGVDLTNLIGRLKALASGETVSSDKNQRPAAPAPAASSTSQATESKPAAKGPGPANGPGKKVVSEGTIKINTTRLDLLINMVGELMVAQSMVSQDLGEYFGSNQRLKSNTRHLQKITRELQELSMSMRMVPVHGIFQKMARLVRDLSRKSGKDIEFRMDGAETELDRNVVESIADPLVHMVRNSVDHGIESPEDRKAAGKPPTGIISLRAFHQGGNIVIEISDDGKGLNRDRILAKAEKNGVVKKGQEMSDQEIYRLIFHAGLSTAEKVTDISGRGVGMDVVRKNIEELRGGVDIDSKPGEGTVFSIRLPLTLAVIDGQIVTVGKEKYIVPMLAIEQSLRPAPEQISTVYGGEGEAVKIRDSLLPLIRLHQVFDIEPDHLDPCQSLVVVVTEGENKCCLLVDDLIGQQQVVIKSLGSFLGSIRGVSGSAIMGDGNVALILDVPSLIHLAQNVDAPAGMIA